jgi:hypothetical protein
VFIRIKAQLGERSSDCPAARERSNPRMSAMISRLGLIACFLFSVPISISAQQEKVRWERVYTGEDSIIEIDASSLKFDTDRILRATFRTVLTKPERLPEKSGINYKSRFETIAFTLVPRRYRFEVVDWLDGSGKVVQSYKSPASGDWKALKAGGIMERLFNAMNALPPFGSWRVLAYRFADGPPDKPGDASVTRLVGTRVRINSEQAEVAERICLVPTYQSRRYTSQEFAREHGVELRTIGVEADFAESITIKCENGWQPPQSLLIQLPREQMLLLWDGLFFVLGKREHFQVVQPWTLRRRAPAQ